MLFNSFAFALFLPVVFLLYWFGAGKRLQYQNIILLIASYYFYACWDWRFLFLLIFSTLLDYITGQKIFQASGRPNKLFWFCLSIGINLGFLAFFKYYNFFTESFATALSKVGLHTDVWTLKIILPVGISFYTFHGLSYIIDIYYGRIKPERDIVSYALFVSFFPLLVAGPIERATHLLPQITVSRKFTEVQARDGMRQMLWGFFKKIVIADNCARYVNEIFSSYTHQPGIMLIAGGLLFAFQIYADFSGYSDIAIGCAKLFGISLMRNFANPYFSRDPAEFWRRWHISLSSWLRDYLFIPLGGNRVTNIKFARNIMIVFLVSGLWHGAAWTFIVWGALHGLFYLFFSFIPKHKTHLEIVAAGRYLPSFKEALQMLMMFVFNACCFVVFRSLSVADAVHYVAQIFTKPFGHLNLERNIFGYLLIMLIIEWLQRTKSHGLDISIGHSRTLRWGLYMVLAVMIYVAGTTSKTFIYFQF